MSTPRQAPGDFCWFELATSDQAAAKRFYSAIFGWQAVDSPMAPGEIYTIFKIDGRDAAAGYTLRPGQRAQGVPPNWMVYVLVKNVDDSAARAKRSGGTVLVDPFDVMDAGRMSVIQDPTGGIFCIWQMLKSGGTGIADVPGTAVWVDIGVTDQAKGAKFYSDLFGWKMVEGESMKPASPGGYYHIVNAREMIGGIPPAEYRAPGAPSQWLIYFKVGDCDGTVAKVQSLGGRVVVPTTTMENVRKYAVLADPQGAVFAIVEALAMAKPEAAPKAAAAPRRPPSAPAPATTPARKAAAPRTTTAKATRTKTKKQSKKTRKSASASRTKKGATRKTRSPQRRAGRRKR